jgi:hypothetical protein
MGFKGGTIFPNDPTVVQTITMQKYPPAQVPAGQQFRYDPEILTQPNLDEYKAGHTFFVVYADVSYSDLSGNKHWTKYCVAVTAAGQPSGATYTGMNCPAYNAVDGN